MSTALHMAGPLYPADLAVYLLPCKTQCSKSEAFLQGSSLVLLFPALLFFYIYVYLYLSQSTA